MPDAWLPVRYRHIRGRDSGDGIDASQLGKPYMDVILSPGDVLYVPRGCFHLTSTPQDPENERLDINPSLHLTVGMEAMLDGSLSTTWEAIFGAGSHYQHDHVLEAYFTAIGSLTDKNVQFREAIPREMLRGDKNHSTWRPRLRSMLHEIVDGRRRQVDAIY